jgi:hypothetical protein
MNRSYLKLDKFSSPQRETIRCSKETKKREEIIIKLPVSEGKGGREYKYLQTLIKKMAEERGYRAIIEQMTPDALGSVDVGLEKDGKKLPARFP